MQYPEYSTRQGTGRASVPFIRKVLEIQQKYFEFQAGMLNSAGTLMREGAIYGPGNHPR